MDVSSQYMVKEDPYFPLDLIEDFFYWCEENDNTGNWLGDSIEQLWLAFVMHKKYGKVWDGQEWVKEEKE